jgi:nucleolar protein 58
MVGELIGARLISHAGSLMNLAKHPSSTVQILGAEKALFRALKNKSATPKYGLLYHASLVGQSAPKLKGKISRVLAARLSLAIRVDALGEGNEPTVGKDWKEFVEKRLGLLEDGDSHPKKGMAKANVKSFKPAETEKKHDADDDAPSSPKKKKSKADASPMKKRAKSPSPTRGRSSSPKKERASSASPMKRKASKSPKKAMKEEPSSPMKKRKADTISDSENEEEKPKKKKKKIKESKEE